jgi:hypothetical protein
MFSESLCKKERWICETNVGDKTSGFSKKTRKTDLADIN